MQRIGAFLLCALLASACTARDQDEGRAQVQRAVHSIPSSIPSPVKQGVSDAALTTEVAGVIAGESGLNVFHITPSAHDGVVTLRGTVPTAAIKSTIIASVQKLHGVRSIVDEVRVGGK